MTKGEDIKRKKYDGLKMVSIKGIGLRVDTKSYINGFHRKKGA